MRSLIISDMHLKKNLFDIEPNKHSNIDRQSMNQIWSLCVVEYIKEIINTIDYEIDTIIFLGDVFDLPSLKQEQTIEFKELLDFILSREYIQSIYIIVGNHDCSSRKQNTQKTPLRFFINYNEKVQILFYTTPVFIRDKVLILLPFKLRAEVLPEMLAIRNITQDRNVYLLTHNNIYIENSFRETQMTSYEEIKESLCCDRLLIINGHIHVKHYETDYFQPGSVNPTSFKYTPNAYGIVYYNFNTDEYFQYKNRKVLFLAVNNFYYIPQLIELIEQAIKFNAYIFLKYPEELKIDIDTILQRYNKVVIGVKEIPASPL